MSKSILSRVRSAIRDFQMINSGDRIALGISGGKDSLCLAHCLNEIRKYSPVPFELVGIHLDLGFPAVDLQPIKNYFLDRQIPFNIVTSDLYGILRQHLTTSGKLPCSLCSKFKKALIIQAAKDHGCNKVAFAHHGDDAIETLWLNAIYGGKLAVFRPIMTLSRTEMTFIRPLIYLRESEIRSLIAKYRLPTVNSGCPNDGNTQREAVKKLLADIYTEYPQAYENFLVMLRNSRPEDLWLLENQENKGGD